MIDSFTLTSCIKARGWLEEEKDKEEKEKKNKN